MTGNRHGTRLRGRYLGTLLFAVPQQALHTVRLTLVPLADEHLEWEVELDSDPG